MRRLLRSLTLVLVSINFIFSQELQTSVDLSDYLGGWRDEIDLNEGFDYDVNLQVSNQRIFVEFRSGQIIKRVDLTTQDDILYYGNYKDQLEIRLKYQDHKPILFLRTGNHLCHLKLEKIDENRWSSKWKLLITELDKANLLLSIDRNNDTQYYASVFFKEPTFHYMSGQDFIQRGDSIYFRDGYSGMKFKGRLVDRQNIDLDIEFLGTKLHTRLTPYDYSQWNRGLVDHQTIKYSSIENTKKFSELTKAIQEDTLEKTHAVVISKDNQIIYETYFDGFGKRSVHDTRSVAKSFASACVGIAIKKKLLASEHQLIRPFFDYPDIDWSEQKDQITIKHLLTMSSGLDAIDFGLNRMSFANEGNYQNSPDWSKFILSAPMVNTPGAEANYGSGNPQLLSNVLAKSIGEPIEFFIHEELFEPLDIYNYRILLTNTGEPYFGGGWYFSPMDLIKFGQLYLRDGNSPEGESIITKEWVEKSLDNHLILKNTFDLNGYGYLFWHKTYHIENKEIKSIECRGTGGQYVFIVPEENMVAVITSGNYRNGKGFQPERIMQEYILPVILK